MVRRLVNEKTLELNISHELMEILGVHVFGFTLQEEGESGGDITFYPPLGNPLLIQYKRTRSGTDGTNGKFEINNNRGKNQHLILDMISRSGMIDTYYFFPLIISDNFLTSNFGRLLEHTIIIEASNITGSLNWRDTAHKIEVNNDGRFNVFSNVHKGYSGIKISNFLEVIKKKIYDSETIDMKFNEYIISTISKLEEQAISEKIIGQSEHTFLFFGKNEDTNDIRYIQMPIMIRGYSDYARK